MAKTLVVRLTTKLERRIARLARARKTTQSETVRALLEGSLAVAELEELRRAAEPYARAAGFVTDEDYFRAIS